MTNPDNTIWQSEMPAQLAKVLAETNSQQVMCDFLRDVMTQKEITEIAARLEAAKLLTQGNTYKVITEKTKLSSRTVARISDWLQSGRNGYSSVIAQLNSHHDHIPPAHAQ